MNRIGFGLVALFMAIMISRELLGEWRDFRSSKTKAKLQIKPVDVGQEVAIGSISGSGSARIDIRISLKDIKKKKSDVYCSLHFDHNSNRQTEILGFVPVPEEDEPKSFRVYKSLPDDFEVEYAEFCIDTNGPWEGNLSVEFEDPTSHPNAIEFEITAYSDGAVGVDLSKLNSFNQAIPSGNLSNRSK